MRRISVYILLLILSVLLLAGCSVFKEDQRVVLWTDRPEFAAYAQAFNSAQKEYVVEVVYKDSSASALKGKKVGRWDVAIGPFLNSVSLNDTFMPLESLFSDGTVSKPRFYQGALEKGVQNGHQMLLPFSFNVPAFIFQSGKIKQEFDSFALAPGSFSAICLDFNNAKSRHAKSAFSPLWNPKSLFFFSILSPGLCSQFEAGFEVRQQDVETGLSYVRQLIEDLDGGIRSEMQFRDKYLYKNPLELLDSSHIFFWYSDVGSFYTLPADRRQNLDFRYYLNSKGKVAACEDMLWLGIPKKGGNTMGAVAFIKWMMSHDVQQDLILRAREMDIRSFGLAGGFSALRTVNEDALPQLYPFVTAFIPQDDYLAFPDPCPTDWYTFKNGALIPYLVQECISQETSRKLWEVTESWRRMNAGQ
jgi:ABC-type glycerol-3-phosphate transport system substrate-binding protein